MATRTVLKDEYLSEYKARIQDIERRGDSLDIEKERENLRDLRDLMQDLLDDIQNFDKTYQIEE